MWAECLEGARAPLFLHAARWHAQQCWSQLSVLLTPCLAKSVAPSCQLLSLRAVHAFLLQSSMAASATESASSEEFSCLSVCTALEL